MRVLDHPVIRNCEETGYPDGREPKFPICPVCGAETDTYFKCDTEVVGCSECITKVDAWEEL